MGLVLTSYGRYGWLDLKYPQAPAYILLENISRIAIINRSQTSFPDSKLLAEQVRTGEIGGSDRQASHDCLKGAFDLPNVNPYYSIVFLSKTRYPGTGSRVASEILSWDTVVKICQ